MTLKNKTYSAVRWTALSSVFRTILQVLQVAVLARLLSPDDYGLIAIVTVLISFVNLFADLGMNSAFVQRQVVTLEERSSLFWLNIFMSVGVTIFVIATSPIFSWFFKDPRLEVLIILSSSIFIISALGQQLRMSAEKELNFLPVAVIEVASAILGFIVAVSVALKGWGVYTLIVSSIVSALISTLFSWFFISNGWRPIWRFHLDDVKSYLSFGGATVANKIVNHINKTIDLFLGGRLLSSTELGIYSVPRNLILQLQFMVNPIITRVGFPLIAQVQTDLERVKSIYLKTLNLTASINAPLYLGMIFLSQDIIYIFLGPKWSDSSELLYILAAWGFLRSTMNPVGSLLLGMGRANLSLKWNIALLFVIPPALWIGSFNGTAGLAWALFIVYIFIYIPVWFFLIKPICDAALLEYMNATLRPLLLALLSILPAYFLVIMMNIENSLTRIFFTVLMSAPLYLVFSYKFNPVWYLSMKELINRGREV